MFENKSRLSRRSIIRSVFGVGALALMSPAAFAEELAKTPDVEEGPFYPYRNMPLDRDNDLIVNNGSATPAIGVVSHLGGRILDRNGSPIKDALVEIWQCDANGIYVAQGDVPRRDKNFQGYGRFETSAAGEYRFRTIKPVPYSGRPAPHIHFRISKGGKELLTTQLFIRGYAGNKQDGIFRNIKDPIDRELVSVNFDPVKDSKIEETAATFEIIVGKTPADADHH